MCLACFFDETQIWICGSSAVVVQFVCVCVFVLMWFCCIVLTKVQARPDGESTRGKAKFGKRWKPQVGRRELLNTKASPRAGEETAANPLPHTMCHTPLWASAGRVAFYNFVFLKRRKCIRGHFLVVFGIRSGPSQWFFRIRRGIRRHPRVRWQICESKWLLFRTLPCDVAA